MSPSSSPCQSSVPTTTHLFHYTHHSGQGYRSPRKSTGNHLPLMVRSCTTLEGASPKLSGVCRSGQGGRQETRQQNHSKTVLVAAGNVRKAGPALGAGQCLCCPMETLLPVQEAQQLPAGQESSSPPAALQGSWPEPGSCLGPLPQKKGLPMCSEGASPEPPAQQSQTSQAQRLILVSIINLVSGKPSWNNCCYVHASTGLQRGMQDLPRVQVTVFCRAQGNRWEFTSWWIFREKSQPRLTRIYSETGCINLKIELSHLLFTLHDFHRPLQVWLITFKPDYLHPVDTSSTQKCISSMVLSSSSSGAGATHRCQGLTMWGTSSSQPLAEALPHHTAPLCFPHSNHISHSSANLTLIKYT